MSDETKLFDRVCLIGLGLIGSSLGAAIHKFGLADHVSGYARSKETRDTAVKIGFVDSIHETAAQAAANADLIIICAPIGAMEAITREIAPVLKDGSILTDVGSVKKAVVAAIEPHLQNTVHFIPGHPIAGSEKSGPESGFAELFTNRWCILTPLENSDQTAVDKLRDFWLALGSPVEIMTPSHHDNVLAITSHLPHLIAYSIVSTASDLENVTQSEVIKFSAGGFRDFTRIAASDPTMWRDVFLTNKEAVLEMLGRFSEDLSALQRSIRWSDGDALFDLFTRSRETRRGIIEAGQDTAEPDFGRDHVVDKTAKDK
ncbi:Cyclohexadienyl dehydrogenase [hydrothermal vent metagenome]|uniref:Cyclohexadienyl dehydrogenase n=1 Tax=hydrothermal vent metagenome TaxID=652676 RepID=A0A3B0SDS3_9ZZZZ